MKSSSESVYEPRILYTTERIEYKSLVEKEPSGNTFRTRQQCLIFVISYNLFSGNRIFVLVNYLFSIEP